MRRSCLSILLVTMTVSCARAGTFTISTKNQIVRLNGKMCGCVVDFTANHCRDNRFWSDALCHKREMYVYLPPGYDPAERYPIMIWMHGFIQDEKNFLDLAPIFDKAIACGQLPPMIIACPDGSIGGRPSVLQAGSFYINSEAGRFEDYMIVDVWNFLNSNFSIRPEPEAHVLAGGSMGGFGAYNLAIKHRDCFKVVAGFLPPLNMRYADCHGRYMSKFDPDCVGIQERYRPHATIGCFFGVVHIQEKHLIDPLFGKERQAAVFSIARENPMEMLDAYGVKPTDLSMFIGYGGRDEFNLAAQVESFLDFAKKRGFEPYVVYDPKGRHNTETGIKMMPEFAAWITPLIKNYAPPLKIGEPCLK